MTQKIVLIKPCWEFPIDRGDSTYNRAWPPLSLLNCAAILRDHGFHVSVIDASAERLPPEIVAKRAEGADIAFITSASLDRWQCPNLEITPFLKTVYAVHRQVPALYVMGTHGTVRTREILDRTNATAVIRGEPEMTVLDLCRGLTLENVAGISWYRNEELIHNPSREDVDLAALPLPAYDLVDLNNYSYVVLGDRFAILEASRGCPFNCIFCVKSMYGTKYRRKTPEQIIREIDAVIDSSGARSIYFIDLEFTVSPDTVRTICRHLASRGNPVTWCCQTRADSVNEELLHIMKSAGCRIVHYGVETGSERIRPELNKGVTREQIETGLKLTRAAGMQTVCFFMFGLPNETLDDMEETIRFAKQLNPTYASFHIALPYPGTAFHQRVEPELGGELFPYAYTGVVGYPDLERIAKRAFRSYYLRPRYIAGRLKEKDFTTFFKQAKFFLSYLKHRLWS